VIGDAVLHDLVRQARQLQQVAHHTLERITEGESETLTLAELCLCLKTVCSLAECANGSVEGNGKNAFGFPANLTAPVFQTVIYSKPDSHCWVRHNDDLEAKEGFHVPYEIAVAIKQQFPQYFVVI